MKAKIALVLAVLWGLFTLIGMTNDWKDSVPLIFFMSGYAIVVSHLAEWAGHRAEESD